MKTFESSLRPTPELAPSPHDATPHALTLWVQSTAIALLAALPLVVTPWGIDAYTQPKSLVLYGLAGAAALGWAIAYLTGTAPPWRITRPEIAIWVFVLAVLISSWVTIDARLTFFGAPGRYDGLFAMTASLVLYFAGVHFFGSQRGFHRLTTALAVPAIIVIAYGVAQVFLPPAFQGEAALRTSYGSLGFTRSLSTLGSPLLFGGYLSLLLPLLLALSLSASDRFWVVWLTTAGLGYVALAFTLTRAAWLAGAIGTGIFAMATRGKARGRRAIAIFVVLAAIAIGVTVLATAVATPSQVAARFSSSFSVESGSVADHLFIWKRTIALIRFRPLLGWGLETLLKVFPDGGSLLVDHFGPRPVTVDKAHNDLLQMAVSIGIPGATAYVAIWILVVAGGIRIWRHASGSVRVLIAGWLGAVIAYLVQAQFSFTSVALGPLVWLLAGAVCGWEATENDGNREPGNSGTKQR